MSNLLEQASLVMIPSGYKEDVVYSEIPLNGSGDLTFTRASDGTRINSQGLVEVVPWNLLLNTDTFSSWNLEGGTLTSGFTAPDGTSTAYKYVQIPGGGLYSGSGGVTADVKFAQVWIKSVSGGSITCNISDGAVYFGTFNVTGEWQLFTAPYTANTRIGLYLYAISNASGIYVWHPQLNIGSTAKPYFPTTDRLNVPRLTYQNGGGGCPSLLLEKQSTNLVQRSDEFDNAYWSKYLATVSANTAISPDGTQNADLIYPSSTVALSGQLYRQITTGISSGNVVTVSAFVKASGKNFAYLSEIQNSFSPAAYFNLTTGAITNISAGVTASMTSFSNSWWRISITSTAGAGSYYAVIGSTDSAGSHVNTVSGTNGILVYGYQCEVGEYATSYIPTTSSSATRVADDCVKNGIGALIGGTSGTVFFDVTTNPVLSSANYKQFCYYFDSASAQSYMYLDGSNLLRTNANWGSLVSSTLQPNTRYKVALTYAPNDFALYINGVSVATASSGTPKDNVNISIGQYGGTEMCEFVFNQYTHFKSRLTNAELASLTTI